MIIIIEGCDSSGKTTLMEAFRSHTPHYFWSLRSSGPPGTPEKILDSLLWFAKRPAEFDLVFDRHPAISEFIYGPILRGKNFLSRFTQTTLLNAVDCIVYCRPPDQVIIDNVKRTQQLTGVVEKVQRIIDAYDEMMTQLVLKIPVIQYDFQIHNPQTVVNAAWSSKRGFKNDSASAGASARTSAQVLIDRVEESSRDESFDPS